MAFVDTATMCLKPWDAIIIIAHVKKLVLLSLSEKIGGALKKEVDELRKQFMKEKG